MKKNNFITRILEFSNNLNNDLVKKIFIFDKIPSTNFKAKELIRKGEGIGTAVIAKIQNKGRGRFDRVWESPEGGLYISIVLKPNVSPEKATLLPLLAALAVSKTINRFDLSSTIKWPNDVRINGKKTAGILLESETSENQIDFLILGIGINLNIDIKQFSEELKNITTTISQELGTSIDYIQFLKKLLSLLETYYAMFLKKDYEKILEEWRTQSDTLGKKVKIITSKDEIAGIAYDVDQSGFLIILKESGDYKKVSSGDCVYLI